MKKIAFIVVAAVAAFAAQAESVRGYTRSDGTYVAPHQRSDRNSTRDDNYGTKGNYNP